MMVVVTEYILDADDNSVQFAPGGRIVLSLVKGLGPFQGFFLKYFDESIQVLLACNLSKIGGSDVCTAEFAA